MERTPAQDACFRRALSNMSMWCAGRPSFLRRQIKIRTQLVRLLVSTGLERSTSPTFRYANRGSSVFLFSSAAASPPHAQRGWCTYERYMSRLGKETAWVESERAVEMYGLPAILPPKVVELGIPDPEAVKLSAPLAPRRFAQLIRGKAFTNGTDCAVVEELYTAALQDSFATRARFRYAELGWGDCDAMELATVLLELPCTMLEELNVSGNAIGGAGMQALTSALSKREAPRLQTLTFAYNLAGDDGAGAVAAALSSGTFTSLVDLNMGKNNVGASGARLLGTALGAGHVPNLKWLELYRNPLTSAGVAAIAEALVGLPRLDTLWLHAVESEDAGAYALANALSTGAAPNLGQLRIEGNGLTRDAEQALRASRGEALKIQL